jgi:hypothetical protein
MGNKMYEGMKIDVGLAPVTLNGNATGAYFNLADYRKAIAVLEVGPIAATFTAKLEVFQAINAAGGSGALLAGATATIAANVLVTSCTLALVNVLNGHTVVINGLTFTAHTDTTTVASRQFKIDGNDTADGDALCVCVNHADYGAPGITATNNAGTVTLISTVPGATVITVSETGATVTLATLSAQAYVEIDALTLSAGFTHVACKVTTTSAQIVSAILLRGGQRKEISQKVGASASV